MGPFHGAWPALVTPFKADDTVNVSVLEKLVEYLLDKGVDGFYACGTTGEGLWMPVAQRKLVAETVLARARWRAPVIVHVGSTVVSDALELARHAQGAGAAGLSSIIPPFYQGNRSLFAYFAAIADAAPELPLFPYIFNVSLDAVALMRELTRIPSVAGTKYTGPNMFELRQIVEMRGENWTVFSGMDEQCLFAAMFGADANIGSTLNFMPGIYGAIRQCVAHGDWARARDLQLQANRITAIAISFGFGGALREMMEILGFPCGQPRLPGRPLEEGKGAALRRELEAAGFWSVAAMQANDVA